MTDFLFYGLLAGFTLLIWGLASLAADALQSRVDKWSNHAIGGLSLSSARVVHRSLATRLRRALGAFRLRSRRVVSRWRRQRYERELYAQHHPRIHSFREFSK